MAALKFHNPNAQVTERTGCKGNWLHERQREGWWIKLTCLFCGEKSERMDAVLGVGGYPDYPQWDAFFNKHYYGCAKPNNHKLPVTAP